jgi:hypothetical protein
LARPLVGRKQVSFVAPPSVPSPLAITMPHVSPCEYSSAIWRTPAATSAAQNRAPALPGSIQAAWPSVNGAFAASCTMILTPSELTMRSPWNDGASRLADPCGALGFAGPWSANVSQ